MVCEAAIETSSWIIVQVQFVARENLIIHDFFEFRAECRGAGLVFSIDDNQQEVRMRNPLEKEWPERREVRGYFRFDDKVLSVFNLEQFD